MSLMGVGLHQMASGAVLSTSAGYLLARRARSQPYCITLKTLFAFEGTESIETVLNTDTVPYCAAIWATPTICWSTHGVSALLLLHQHCFCNRLQSLADIDQLGTSLASAHAIEKSSGAMLGHLDACWLN
jgi:hypothetical protein